MCRECFPAQVSTLPRRFPVYAAFPHSEYYQRVRLPPWLPLPYGWSFQLAYSALAKTAVDLPGSLVLPFPSCRALRPRRGLRPPRPYRWPTIAFQVFDLVGPRTILTRLNRFTLVTARFSLCLRLARVVTSTSPRLDSRWSGSFSFRGGNCTRWKH